MVYQRNKKAKGDPPTSTTIEKGSTAEIRSAARSNRASNRPVRRTARSTGRQPGKSGARPGRPVANRALHQNTANPVADRSTGLRTGESGARPGRPVANRPPTGRQPEELQDQQKASGHWSGLTGLTTGLSGLWPGQTGFLEAFSSPTVIFSLGL